MPVICNVVLLITIPIYIYIYTLFRDNMSYVTPHLLQGDQIVLDLMKTRITRLNSGCQKQVRQYRD
jgi:hypothetical protein